MLAARTFVSAEAFEPVPLCCCCSMPSKRSCTAAMVGRCVESCCQQSWISAANASGVFFGSGRRAPSCTAAMMSEASAFALTVRSPRSQNECGLCRVNAASATCSQKMRDSCAPTFPHDGAEAERVRRECGLASKRFRRCTRSKPERHCLCSRACLSRRLASACSQPPRLLSAESRGRSPPRVRHQRHPAADCAAPNRSAASACKQQLLSRRNQKRWIAPARNADEQRQQRRPQASATLRRTALALCPSPARFPSCRLFQQSGRRTQSKFKRTAHELLHDAELFSEQHTDKWN